MDWFAAIFAKYPELPVFLVVGIGYWVGGFKFRGFGLGPVTGSLIVGVLVGYFFKVPISSTAKSILFLMFLFSIGYSVGPKFFQAMKGDGLRWAGLAAFICAVGLGTAFGVAKVPPARPRVRRRAAVGRAHRVARDRHRDRSHRHAGAA